MHSPPHALVCFAVEQEAKPFRKLCASRNDLRVLVTGMGPRRAENGLRALLREAKPALVFTCGFAGGLDPGLPPGTVVFSGAPKPLGALLAAAGARAVRFHCATRVATTAVEKQALRQQTGADAVEMESGVIEGICQSAGVPCLTVRIILDGAQQDLPLDFNALTNANQDLDYPRLMLAIAKAPGKIPALLRLGREGNQAAQILANTLMHLAASPEFSAALRG